MIRYSYKLPSQIKIISDQVVRKSGATSRPETLEYIKLLCHHFIRHPNPMVVPVYRFDSLGRRGGLYYYTYDMMRLGILSPEEKYIIENIYQFRAGIDNLTLMSFGIIFPEINIYSNLFHFMKKILIENRYNDLHAGNVLKDMEDNYRLVDLEGYIGGDPLDDSSNNWITRD